MEYKERENKLSIDIWHASVHGIRTNSKWIELTQYLLKAVCVRLCIRERKRGTSGKGGTEKKDYKVQTTPTILFLSMQQNSRVFPWQTLIPASGSSRRDRMAIFLKMMT